MMYGLTKDQVFTALNLGWSSEEIWNLHVLLDQHQLKASKVLEHYIIMAYRYIIYRGQGCAALEKFLKTNPTSVVLWTDGSATIATLPAGIGCVVFSEMLPGTYERTLVSENIGLGTNNFAELMAIKRGLEQVPDLRCKIQVHSDSAYAIGSCTQPWNGTKNRELIQNIRQDLRLRKGYVEFHHVDGHSGVEGNELADRLAKAGRKGVPHGL